MRSRIREADADEADAAVGGQLALVEHPRGGILDLIGQPRRHLVVQQVGQLRREHGEAARREVARELRQAWFVQAFGVHARRQHDRAFDAPGGYIEARAQRALARRDGDLPRRELVDVPAGQPVLPRAVEAGRADDEARAPKVPEGHGNHDGERDENRDDRDETARGSAAHGRVE